MKQSAIAKYLKISKSIVAYWIERYEKTGDVQTQEGRGKKRKTTEKSDKFLIELFENDDELSLSEAQRKMKRRKVNISTKTISRRLKETGMKFISSIYKPLLTLQHQEKRLQWCKENKEREWNNVIFTVETTFVLKSYKKRFWGFLDRLKILRIVKHPFKIHVWGNFSSKGFGKLCFFTSNLNTKKMVKIYKSGLMASVKKFGFRSSFDWWLQEDNDPKHTSKLACQWKDSNDIQRIQ